MVANDSEGIPMVSAPLGLNIPGHTTDLSIFQKHIEFAVVTLEVTDHHFFNNVLPDLFAIPHAIT